MVKLFEQLGWGIHKNVFLENTEIPAGYHEIGLMNQFEQHIKICVQDKNYL